MTEFSEKLKCYIRKRGFTNFYFAKICGIDRTLMQKYISGQRIPKSEQMLRIICEKLQMSPDEQREMQELWKKELLGKDVYEQRTAIRGMLEEFSRIVNAYARRNLSVFHVEMYVEKLPQVTLLYTEEEIADMLWGLMNFEMKRDICDVFMVLQPVYDLLDSVLLHLAQSGKVRIHHLLCIDRKQGENRGSYNVQILKKILPLVCAEAEYDVRFYYGDVQEQFSSMSAMPNLILTPSFVLQFDRGMQRGAVYADRGFRAFYQDIYNGMEGKTASFAKKHRNVADTIKYYAQQHPCDCSMQFQPCLAYALTPQMLKEVLRPEMAGDGRVIDELCGMLEAWGKKAVEEEIPANTNFFCMEGISDFMDTGRIAEFPSEFYHPLPPKWRFCMLETFLEQLENGLIEGYLLNRDRVKVDERLVIQLSGRDAVHLLGRNRNDNMTALRLSEGGIVNAFADYMEDMKKSSDVKSREETLELVRMEVEKYRYMK